MNSDLNSLIGLTLNVETDDGTVAMEVVTVFTVDGQDYAALQPENQDYIELLKLKSTGDDFELSPIEDTAEYENARNRCAELMQSETESMAAEYDDDDAMYVEIDGVEYRIADIFTVSERKRQYAALMRTEPQDDEFNILLYRYTELGADDPELVDIELNPIPSDMEFDEVRRVYEERLASEGQDEQGKDAAET